MIPSLSTAIEEQADGPRHYLLGDTTGHHVLTIEGMVLRIDGEVVHHLSIEEDALYLATDNTSISATLPLCDVWRLFAGDRSPASHEAGRLLATILYYAVQIQALLKGPSRTCSGRVQALLLETVPLHSALPMYEEGNTNDP